MTNEQKREQIVAMFGAYSNRLERLYDDFILKLSGLAIKSHKSVKSMLEESPLFHFDDYPELRQELNAIFADYLRDGMLCYRAGITSGVALAYSHDSGLLNGFSVLSDKAISHARETAAETFLRTRLRTAQGLNLSQMVWNYSSQAKSEFEVAIANVLSDGIKGGFSAADLARAAKQYLNDPDMMYRRYHRTIIDAQGNKRDIVRWRRRIIDDTGKVRFVEQPLEQVGMGHYRSARRNAERLMRTEINSAYHHANYERWQLEPFVIGIQIDLSPQHPEYDMCDELKGRYPKDFLFAGWHPQCLCMSNPITIQGDEKKEFYRRLAAGEDMSGYVSPNRVKDVPDGFKQYVDTMHDKFLSAAERGKLGYVWQDNVKYWRGQFSREEQEKMGVLPELHKRVKTEAEKAAIQKRWDERKAKNALIIKTGKNVWGVADNLEYIETIQTKASLRDAILVGDTVRTAQLSKSLAKQIAGINREAKALEGTIPNAKQWLKQFNVQDMKEVEKAVQGNLTKWSDKYATDSYIKSKYASVEDYLLAKLKEEAKYVVDETYLKPHSLYPTSHVAESAYLRQVSAIEHKLEMNALKAEISDIKAFSLAHPKSTPLANLVNDIELLFSEDKDMALLKKDISDAQAIVKRLEREQRLRDMKAGKASTSKLWKNGTPFTQQELDKLMDYEKRIIDGIFSGSRPRSYLIEEYWEYVMELSNKYYDRQLSIFSASQNKEMKQAAKNYLSRQRANPGYVWGEDLGGKYWGKHNNNDGKVSRYIGKLNGLSEEEVSIVKRFTNGSTFSNSYNWRNESAYWRNKFKRNLDNAGLTLSQVKEQYKIIEEWSQGADYALDKMVRFNGITFRGLDCGGGPELRAALEDAFKTGKPWINRGATSTSMDFSVAESFDGDVILVIHNKTGAYIHEISDYAHEYEIMTLRNTKYKVLRPPVQVGSRYYCELEEIV